MLTQDTIARVHTFYQPRLSEGDRLVLSTPRGELRVPWDTERPIALGFGEPAANIQEATAKGFPITNGRELYQALLSPAEFERIRATREPDERTQSFLAGLKEQIGLSTIRGGADGVGFQMTKLVDVELEETLLNGSAEIGRDESGRWVYREFCRYEIDDFATTEWHYGTERPTAEQIETGRYIEVLLNLLWKRRFRPTFTCWECGIKQHWLEIRAGSFREQVESFEDKYCGC